VRRGVGEGRAGRRWGFGRGVSGCVGVCRGVPGVSGCVGVWAGCGMRCVGYAGCAGCAGCARCIDWAIRPPRMGQPVIRRFGGQNWEPGAGNGEPGSHRRPRPRAPGTRDGNRTGTEQEQNGNRTGTGTGTGIVAGLATRNLDPEPGTGQRDPKLEPISKCKLLF
jgi:hypothetical protein